MDQRIVLIRSNDRESGLREVLMRMGIDSILENVDNYVLIKPNFNNMHRYPATTDAETLKILCNLLADIVGRDKLVIGDGSSMYDGGFVSGKPKEHWTQFVMSKLGILHIDVRHAFFEEEEEVPIRVEGVDEPLYYPKTVMEASKIIYVPVLKVHSMPAPFSLGIKNTVGATCYRTRHWMHAVGITDLPEFWKRMIQMNLGIKVDLAVVDGTKMLVSGGPSTGNQAKSNLFMASKSLLAIDVVGGVIMKHHGAVFMRGGKLMTQNVRELPHVKLAQEMGLGKIEDITLETNFKDELTDSIQNELGINVCMQ